MPTVGDSVVRVKRLLDSNTRTELDKLNGAITTGATSVTVTHSAPGIRAGSYLSVGDATQGYETMYVYSVSGAVATVERAMEGSSAVAFTDLTLVEVEPRFSGFQIVSALRDTIRALPENLFAVSTDTKTFSTIDDTSTAITFTNGFTRVLKALRTSRDNEDRKLNANVTVQEFNGAYQLIMREPTEKSISVELTYAHPFVTSTLNVGTDLVSTVLMVEEMTDIPSWGAAAALMMADESSRSDLHARGTSRDDATVGSGDRVRHSLVLQQKFQQRVSEEARRLMAKWGLRDQAAISSVYPAS